VKCSASFKFFVAFSLRIRIAHPRSLANVMLESDNSAESLSEEEFEGYDYEELIDTSTKVSPTTNSIFPSTLSTSAPISIHRKQGNIEM